MAARLKDAIRARTQPAARGAAYHIGITTQELAPSAIRTDGGTQARAELHAATLAEYAEAMQAGAAFPPVVVYYDGSDYWLADGFHRVAAARAAGCAVAADVRPGTRRDAILWAVGANDAHGLRRTREDVRRAIETLLRDAEWGQWADREIARQVHCDHKTVAAVRAALSGEIPHIAGAARTVERGGTVFQQRQRRPAPPAAPATAEPAPEPPEPPLGAVFQLRAAGAHARALQQQARRLTAAQRQTIAQEIAALIAVLEETRAALVAPPPEAA